MNRISNQMINNTLIHNLRRHQIEMDQTQERLSTGKNVRLPRDNPIATGNQMLYNSRLTEIKQYVTNIGEGMSRLNEADTAVQSMTRIFHRIRVLTVELANGTYSTFERRDAAAVEINQFLEELVKIGNTTGAMGRPIFGGHQTGSEDLPNPFVPIYQAFTDGFQGTMITGVEYRGNIGGLFREVAKGEYMSVNVPGNQLFWATNQILTSNLDSSTYAAATNQIINIDGLDVNISAGDNLDMIIDKINNTGLSVRASKGGRNNLILETTAPHQMWLRDSGSGTVLQDLGLINPDRTEPPNNFAPNVSIGGMSVFEAIITIRDDFIRGDVELIGGRDLGLIDMALENVLRHQVSVGAKSSRLDELARRSEYEKTNIYDMIAKTEGIDFPEEIMNLKWLDTVHQYALAVGARSIKPTLMDFLR
ncbi:MAG: flagellar hook-associated protein 3 [Leptospirales bacterium]|nr:flagellar hook-associated protein 3 [Leptospirales bacterium]